MDKTRKGKPEIPIEKLDITVYNIPTDLPEADGTFDWNSTTMVLVRAEGGGRTGFGYSYADTATAHFIREHLASRVTGMDAMDIPAAWLAMVEAIRNQGRPGIASMAISAVDTALWDLKARLLDLPLVSLLGQLRESVPVYGSGGFTTYTNKQLQDQLGGWAEQGIKMVKMKIGTHPEDDPDRVKAARQAIGPDTALFVDANGAYSRKQALAMAAIFKEEGVSWFEEPVSSDDLVGLRLIRDQGPAGMDITAGEYGYDAWYFRRMLEAEAVDVLQADVTRCGGITGFQEVAALCWAFSIPLSGHCAPSLHAHVACSAKRVRHLEYFHDHARIEKMFFEGTLLPVDGALRPDLSRPGNGLELKKSEAERYLKTAL